LFDEIYFYKRAAYKKWLCLSFGILIGICLAVPTQIFLPSLLYAKYDRTGLDDLAKATFGDLTFDDITVDELFIPAFSYNYHKPRFFSKYFKNLDPGTYDKPLWRAVTASGSAPIFFAPAIQKNEYNRTESLIDGGVICNSPSMYAYFHAKFLLQKKGQIRVLSLGTGEPPLEESKKEHDD